VGAAQWRQGIAVSLPQELQESARRFSLFAALRLLESEQDATPLGTARRLRDDPVRVSQPPHLNFVATEVASVEQRDGMTHLRQYVFGLMGPNGPLPLHLTEYAHARLHQEDDAALADFLAAIQHRLTTLFYRAWAAADPVSLQGRPFAEMVGSLVGLGVPESRGRDSVDDHAKLRRAGALLQQARSADGLQSLLQDFLGVAVHVESFVGEWLPIVADAALRLGGTPSNAMLGAGATLGDKCWQRASRFEVSVGPMDRGKFEALLPGTPGIRAVRDLVALYTNREWSWDLRLITTSDHTLPAMLSSGAKLGWTSWLGSPGGCAVDVVLQGDEAGV
jgi:type VI secretion system protein ImpH